MTDDGALPTDPMTGDTQPRIKDLVLAAALPTLGVRETAPNSSPEIDAWLWNVGQLPGAPWCAAWLHSMFLYATRAAGIANPCPRSAAALGIWRHTETRYQLAAGIIRRDPSLLVPGMAFVEEHPGGKGHCGLVLGWTSPDMDLVRCLSGNTNEAGSREGNCVGVNNRPLARMLGVIDFDR